MFILPIKPSNLSIWYFIISVFIINQSTEIISHQYFVFILDYEVIGEAKWQTLDNNGTENEVYAYGYKYSKFRAVLFHTLCILSCGIPYFALAYYPMIHRCKYINVSLRQATAIGSKWYF